MVVFLGSIYFFNIFFISLKYQIIKLKKNQPTLKCKRVQARDETSSPPIGAPSWCLNEEALNRFNRSDDNIPRYDYDTEDYDDSNNNDTDNIYNNDNEDANTSRGKRKTDANTSRKKRKTNSQKKLKQKKRKHKNRKNNLNLNM